MPLFRALAKNMAASYFGESALRFCNGSYTSVCLYSVKTWNSDGDLVYLSSFVGINFFYKMKESVTRKS